MSIVCSGSVAYDYLMRFPGYFKDHLLPEHIEKVSLSFLVDEMTKLQGGIAPNISYSLALLGFECLSARQIAFCTKSDTCA